MPKVSHYDRRRSSAEAPSSNVGLRSRWRNRRIPYAVPAARLDSRAMPHLGPGHIAPPLSVFVGRERELAEITSLLATRRLVTILGPGGTGKTRMATEVAAAIEGHLVDTVGFVDVATLKSAPELGRAVLASLRLELPQRDD